MGIVSTDSLPDPFSCSVAFPSPAIVSFWAVLNRAILSIVFFFSSYLYSIQLFLAYPFTTVLFLFLIRFSSNKVISLFLLLPSFSVEEFFMNSKLADSGCFP